MILVEGKIAGDRNDVLYWLMSKLPITSIIEMFIDNQNVLKIPINLELIYDAGVDVDINGTVCLLVQNNETVIDFKVGVNCIVPDFFVKKMRLKPLILESGILPSPASTPTLKDSYIKIDGEQVFFVK